MPWTPSIYDTDLVFLEEQMHVRTRLKNGRIGLLVDPGAFDNLCGSHWLLLLCVLGRKFGKTEQWYELSKRLGVEGVGSGVQEVTHGVRVPICLDAHNSDTVYVSPVVPDSYIPGLLGLRSMEDKQSVLDMRIPERKLYCGPVKIIPLPGCVVHQLEAAVSGHLILPCDNFGNVFAADSSKKTDGKAFHSTFK